MPSDGIECNACFFGTDGECACESTDLEDKFSSPVMSDSQDEKAEAITEEPRRPTYDDSPPDMSNMMGGMMEGFANMFQGMQNGEGGIDFNSLFNPQAAKAKGKGGRGGNKRPKSKAKGKPPKINPELKPVADNSDAPNSDAPNSDTAKSDTAKGDAAPMIEQAD